MTRRKRCKRKPVLQSRPEHGTVNEAANGTAVATMELATESVSPEDFKVESTMRAVPRADELSPEQLEEYGMKYRLICLIISGRSPRQALEYLKPEYELLQNRTERWAQKLFKQYQNRGPEALIDHRRNREREAPVMTGEVKRLILAWFFGRPAAGYKLIWKLVTIECNKRGDLQPPSYSAVKKYLRSLPKYLHLVREGRIELWDKKGIPVVRFNLTTHANQRWQIDHNRPDIWIRVWDGEKWVPEEVWLSLVLDAHTRAIPGFVLSTKVPDAWTTSLLLRAAILPKERAEWKNRGLPEVLQPDNGKDFRSHAIEVSMAYLGITLDFDPPYYPNRKGKIERFFLTLDRGCLRALPGHMDAVGRSVTSAGHHINTLLTRRQLYREIENYIVDDYHRRTHSETGSKPGEQWERTVRLRMPESEDALNQMLLKFDETRKIQNVGVSFHYKGKGGNYWSPGLIECLGQDVKIRFNPDDLESILLYDAFTEQFICEAWLMEQADSKYVSTDVKQAQSQFRAGLVSRMADYAREVQVHDRKKAEETEWEEAKRLVEAASQQSDSVAGLDKVQMEDVNRILDQLEREARGEI